MFWPFGNLECGLYASETKPLQAWEVVLVKRKEAPTIIINMEALFRIVLAGKHADALIQPPILTALTPRPVRCVTDVKRLA